MRVLFFNYEYPPLGGGAANATFCILREYSKIPNLTVDLITSSVDANYHQEKIGENIFIHKIPIGKNEKNLHFQSQKELLVYLWRSYNFSKKLLIKNKYDLTHSFFTVPCGLVSLLLRYQHKIPYIISLRGSDVPGYSDRFSLIYALLKPLFRLIWKKAEAVISNSKGLKNLALKTNPDQKIEIIYNGVDTDKFKPDNDLKNRNKFIITPGASRITTRKGLRYLIEAADKLLKKYPQVHLKIMGEGDAKKSLQELVMNLNVENNVEFLGRIPRGKTFPYYQEADVFILTSFNEGMSNAMLEALASGLPIISTDTGGAEELVENGENGYMIKMKNSTDVAEKIEKLINNSELAKRMGEKSREKALEMSWKNIATEYFGLYKNYVKKIR
jgi:glycosyltransferase involved in cell wall biosynthesis